MKILCLYFSLFFICVSSLFSQNWFVGGNVFFRFNDNSNENENIIANNSDKEFRLSPMIGYKFDKFDCGLSPIFQYRYRINEQKSNYNYYDTRQDEYEFYGFGLGGFYQYRFITLRKFSILGRLSTEYIFSIDTSKSTTTYEHNEDKHQYSNKSETFRHDIKIIVTPVLEYRLLNNLIIFSSFGDIASLLYQHNNSGGGRYDNLVLFSFLQNIRIDLSSISIGFYVLF